MLTKNQINNEVDNSRKTEAIALAKKISSENGNGQLDVILKEIQKFEISNGNATRKQMPDMEPDPGTLGIWTYNESDKMFVRDEKYRSEWILWAKMHQIPIEKTKSERIVFLGESVARGYLYDPVYTPAKVLEDTINAVGTKTDVEVIDLAKSDMNMSGLLTVAKQSLALAPDTIVIFAGNNFLTDLYKKLHSPKLQQKDVIEPIVSSFTERGFKGIQEKLENELEATTNELVGYFTELAANSNTKVVFVIPEYNLADWSVPEMSKPLPNLSGDQLHQWVENQKKLTQLLQNGDLEEAASSAKALIEIDPTHPLGYESLAKVNLKQNDLEQARKNLENARDTSFRSIGRARMFSIIRETILTKVEAAQNIQIVDLQEIFKEHLQGEIPGRGQFLDYCHLSVEGIQVSMGHTAQRILSNFFDESVSIEAVMKHCSGLVPDSETVSKAHFYAAIHNGHNGQDADVLYYHCSKSLEASPNIAKSMLLLSDLASRKASNEICKSFEELVMLMSDQQYPPGFLHPRNAKLLDLDLTDAMLKALKEKDINQTSAIQTLRKEEHGVKYEKVDLLQSLYSKNSYDERVGSKLPFYQAFDLKTDFYFVADRDFPVEFRITAKSRNLADADFMIIEVNNVQVSKLEINGKWATHTFKVDAKYLVNETNIISIKWPVNTHNEQNFQLNKIDHFYEIFDLINYASGEIYAFEAYVTSEDLQLA